MPSSNRKNTRSCFQVRRITTNSKLRPTHGWNGWVTRTVLVATSGSGVFDGGCQRRGRILVRRLNKNELVYAAAWPTIARLRPANFDYIEVFYNRQRRHSSLGRPIRPA